MPVNCAPLGIENAKLSQSCPMESVNIWPLIVLMPTSRLSTASPDACHARSPETASLYVRGDAAARAAGTSTSAATPPTRTRVEILFTNPNGMKHLLYLQNLHLGQRHSCARHVSDAGGIAARSQ